MVIRTLQVQSPNVAYLCYCEHLRGNRSPNPLRSPLSAPNRPVPPRSTDLDKLINCYIYLYLFLSYLWIAKGLVLFNQCCTASNRYLDRYHCIYHTFNKLSTIYLNIFIRLSYSYVIKGVTFTFLNYNINCINSFILKNYKLPGGCYVYNLLI